MLPLPPALGLHVGCMRLQKPRRNLAGQLSRRCALLDRRGMAWGCDLSYDYVKINAEYTT